MRNGRLHFTATGLSMRWMFDLYHLCLRISWPTFLLGLWCGYLLLNLLFSLLYIWEGWHVSGVEEGDFWAVYWFSVQTLSTIGYGGLSPTSWWSNLIATVESFAGLVMVAMGTGVMFARFARPTARIGFSETMVIHHRNGVPCLMFRMANERSSHIVEAQLQVSVLQEEHTQEGSHLRRFRPLELERERTPLFTLTWTVIHPLTPDSPLHGLSPENQAERLAAIVVTCTGIDDLFAQTVHARHLYTADQIRFNHQFEDILETDEQGHTTIHHAKLSQTQPLPADHPAAMPLTPGRVGPSSGL
jgi:inward rectifier potassium channel